MAVQRGEGLAIELQAAAFKVAARLLRVEPQLLAAELQQLALGAQRGQAQRRLRTTADGQGEVRRRQLDQAVERGEQFRVLDQVQIVEHQQQRLLALRQVDQQALHDGLDRHPHGVAQIAQGILAQAGQRAAEGVYELLEEAHRLVVAGAERQPGDGGAGMAAFAGEHRQGSGLAKARRGGKQHETGMRMG